MSNPSTPTSYMILHNHASPGDVLVMTGVVRDLALAHPGRFNVTIDSYFPDLWLNNPHATHLHAAAGNFRNPRNPRNPQNPENPRNDIPTRQSRSTHQPNTPGNPGTTPAADIAPAAPASAPPGRPSRLIIDCGHPPLLNRCNSTPRHYLEAALREKGEM